MVPHARHTCVQLPLLEHANPASRIAPLLSPPLPPSHPLACTRFLAFYAYPGGPGPGALPAEHGVCTQCHVPVFPEARTLPVLTQAPLPPNVLVQGLSSVPASHTLILHCRRTRFFRSPHHAASHFLTLTTPTKQILVVHLRSRPLPYQVLEQALFVAGGTQPSHLALLVAIKLFNSVLARGPRRTRFWSRRCSRRAASHTPTVNATY